MFGALNPFLRNARNCGSGKMKFARNCGYAEMEELRCAVSLSSRALFFALLVAVYKGE